MRIRSPIHTTSQHLTAAVASTLTSAHSSLPVSRNRGPEGAAFLSRDRGAETRRLALSASRIAEPVATGPRRRILPVDQKAIHRLLEKLLRDTTGKDPPIARYDDFWPAVDPFPTDPEIIAAARDRFGSNPVLLIDIPPEKRKLSVHIVPKKTGQWGLYGWSHPNVTKTRWDEMVATMHVMENQHLIARLPEIEGYPPIDPDDWRRMRTDPLFRPEYRLGIERSLLERAPARADFIRARLRKWPEGENWLRLEPVVKRLSLPFPTLRQGMIEYGMWLLRELGRLKDDLHPIPTPLAKKFSASLASLGIRTKWSGGRLEDLTFPKGFSPLRFWDLKTTADLLEELSSIGFLDEDDRDRCQKLFISLLAVSQDLTLVAGEGEVPYTLPLWRRDPRFSIDLGLPSGTYNDLGLQTLTVSLPNGDLAAGAIVRLFWNVDRQAPALLMDIRLIDRLRHWVPQEDIIPAALSTLTRKIAATVGVSPKPGSLDRFGLEVDAIGWTTPPFVPISAPEGAEGAQTRIRRDHPHPYEGVLPWTEGGYEALREVPNASHVVSPWAGDLTGKIGPLLTPREIEPDPEPGKTADHVWAFCTGTGRSVDLSLGQNGMTTPDGTRWHHLNLIGVGRTQIARAGPERRDGRLPLDGAIRRFYLTNLMHFAAGPLGFRTSLGVSIADLGRVREDHERRPGIPQWEAVIAELRREQWRLKDLQDHPKEAADLIRFARWKIERELKMGSFSLSREAYVKWLARTVGEQFALMEFFGFDHGDFERSSQLHPGNVSLAGEICDFDTARFSERAAMRYHDNLEAGMDHVDIHHIRRMEENFWKGKGSDWLGVLLFFARDAVDFSEILRTSHRQKLAALRESGIDPRKRIREFHETRWGPFIRTKPFASFHIP